MQEALGVTIGALIVLLLCCADGYGEGASRSQDSDVPDRVATVHPWISMLLAFLCIVLMLGMAAWAFIGIPQAMPLPSAAIQHQQNSVYVTPGPKPTLLYRIPTDGLEMPRNSRLIVLEEGRRLGPAHSLHADIAEKGAGRYSHWDSWIVFSSSDNSDPRRNGRSYAAIFRVFPSFLSWLLAVVAFCALIAIPATRSGFVAAAVSFKVRAALPVFSASLAIVFAVAAWGLAGVGRTVTVAPAAVQQLEGKAFAVAIAQRRLFLSELTSDNETRPTASTLQVIENGRAIGPAHTPHNVIREVGGGGFSHWGGAVIFSTSDGTDPRDNGRSYQLAFRTYPGHLPWLAAVISVAFLVALPWGTGQRSIARKFPSVRLAITVLFLSAVGLALTLMGQRFAAEMAAPVNLNAMPFGSPHAPDSDAMLWAFGGLQFLLEGPDVPLTLNLYRPTLAIWFGSVMAIFSSIEAVPTFFFFSVLAFLAGASAIALATPMRLLLLLGLWAMLCVTLPDAPIWHTLVTAPMPDLPALLFSLIGLFLVALFFHGRVGLFAGCIGFLFLGAATAIRGALLPAGFILVLLGCWQRGWKGTGWFATMALASFLIPFVFDNLLQRHYQTYNNAVVAFYCVVQDVSRFWTAGCEEKFYREAVGAERVIRDYLSFALSLPGMQFFLSSFAERMRHDLASLWHPAFAVVLMLSALVGAQYLPQAGSAALIRSSRVQLSRDVKRLWSVAMAPLVVIAAIYAATHGMSLLAVLLVFTCVLLSILRRDFLALTCFALYVSGLVMMTAIGASPHFGINTARITATYSFALPLALLAFVLGPSEPLRQFVAGLFDGRRASRVAVTVCGVLVVMLYSAVWLWPSPWNAVFESDVKGRKAALKVFDDAALDRSGYYVFVPNAEARSGAGVLVYTRHDDIPVGSARQYDKLMNNLVYGASFAVPNALLP